MQWKVLQQSYKILFYFYFLETMFGIYIKLKVYAEFFPYAHVNTAFIFIKQK